MELTTKQKEAIMTLCEMFREARRTPDHHAFDPNAIPGFLAAAFLLALGGALDHMIAAVLMQAKELQIPAKISLFRGLAEDIEHAIVEKRKSK